MKDFLLNIVVILFPCIIALLISLGGAFIHLDVSLMNPFEWKQEARVVLVSLQIIWLIWLCAIGVVSSLLF